MWHIVFAIVNRKDAETIDAKKGRWIKHMQHQTQNGAHLVCLFTPTNNSLPILRKL